MEMKPKNILIVLMNHQTLQFLTGKMLADSIKNAGLAEEMRWLRMTNDPTAYIYHKIAAEGQPGVNAARLIPDIFCFFIRFLPKPDFGCFPLLRASS